MSTAAENALLAMALNGYEDIDALDVSPLDFRTDKARQLWDFIRDRRMRGLSTMARDLLAVPGVTEKLKGWGWTLAEIGDLSDLDFIPTNAEQYAANVRRHSQCRTLTNVLRQGLSEAEGNQRDPEELASEVMQGLADSVTRDSATHASIADVVMAVSDSLERQVTGEEVMYIRTGIPEWDDSPAWQGWSSLGMTIFEAASGIGKTTFLNRAAVSTAATGVPVLKHGTETTRERQGRDLVFSVAGLSARDWSQLVKNARANPGAYDEDVEMWRARLNAAEGFLAGLPMTLSGCGLNVDEVCMKARVLHRQGRCGMVIVDYLQDLAAVVRPGLDHSIPAQVGYATTRLKELAATLRIPVHVGAQVSGEKAGITKDPRPQMWDIQWSSRAHQDAEEVYALFRGDYYRERFGDDEWGRIADRLKFHPGFPGVMEIIARKRREGAPGSVLHLHFDGPSKFVGRRPPEWLGPQWADATGGAQW